MNKNVSKKIYLAFEMKPALNYNIYDKDTFDHDNVNNDIWDSPQVNNITFHLPSSPLIYQSNKINKVNILLK
jgi:hypothetical protein